LQFTFGLSLPYNKSGFIKCQYFFPEKSGTIKHHFTKEEKAIAWSQKSKLNLWNGFYLNDGLSTIPI